MSEPASPCAIQVTIWWAGEVFEVRNVHPSRRFVLGADAASADFVMPSEVFGWRRAPLVLPSRTSPMVSVPPGARGMLSRDGTLSVLEEGDCVAAPRGTRVHIELGKLAFSIAVDAPQRRPTSGWQDHRYDGLALFVSLSLLGHAGPLFAALLIAPSLDRDEVAWANVDNTVEVGRYLMATAEKERQPADEWLREGPDRGVGRCGPGREMGLPDERMAGRYGVDGSRDNPDPHVAASSGRGEDLDAAVGGEPSLFANAPSAPWGRQEALGTDLVSARGSMWGDAVQDAEGLKGLAIGGTCGSCGGGSGGASASPASSATQTAPARIHRSPVTARYRNPGEPLEL